MVVGKECEVVDPGVGCVGWFGRFGSGHGVGVPADLLGDALAHWPVLVADLDAGEIERVEHALDLLADQDSVNFEDVPEEADRRCGVRNRFRGGYQAATGF